MKQRKSYKFRICPNEEQKIMFAKTFGCTRFLYNKMLSDKINHYCQNNEMLENRYSQYKAEFKWLKEVDSMALANTQLNLREAFFNFFKNPKIGFPQFKSKHKSKKSYTTNRNISLANGYLKLPKIESLIKVKQHRQIPKGYTIKSVTISQTPSGKYYASILCEYENQMQIVEPKTFLGLDYSTKELYTASDNTSAEYPEYYRMSQEKLVREQRKLFGCIKNSKNWNKQRLKVAKLQEKITNQKKNFLHTLSRQIANAYDCVCIKNLNLKLLGRELKLKKVKFDNSWSTLITFLNYKLKDLGKQLIKIDRWFPSSNVCSNCGNIKEDISLNDKIYHCNCCGITINRNYNASINIRNQGIKLVIS